MMECPAYLFRDCLINAKGDAILAELLSGGLAAENLVQPAVSERASERAFPVGTPSMLAIYL